MMLSTWYENGFTCSIEQSQNDYYYTIKDENIMVNGKRPTKQAATEFIRKYLEDFRDHGIR